MEYEDALVLLVEQTHRGCLQLRDVEDAVRRSFPHANSLAVRRKTLALVRDLIVAHELLPGGFRRINEDEFVFAPWNLPIKCALDLIEHRWATLDRDLVFGDVVWL